MTNNSIKNTETQRYYSFIHQYQINPSDKLLHIIEAQAKLLHSINNPVVTQCNSEIVDKPDNLRHIAIETGTIREMAKKTANKRTTKDFITYDNKVKRVDTHIRQYLKDNDFVWEYGADNGNMLQEAYEELFQRDTEETKADRIASNNALTQQAIENEDINLYVEVNGYSIAYKAMQMLTRLSNIIVSSKDKQEYAQQAVMYLYEVMTSFEEYRYNVKSTEVIIDNKGIKHTKKVKTGDTIVYEYWYEMPAELLYIGLSYRVYNRLKAYIHRESLSSNKTVSINQLVESSDSGRLIEKINAKMDKLTDKSILQARLSPSQYRLLEKIIATGTSNGAGKGYVLLKQAIKNMSYSRDELMSAIKGIKADNNYAKGYAQDLAKEMSDKDNRQVLADILYKLA